MKEKCLFPFLIDRILLIERGTGFAVFGSSGLQAALEPSSREVLWPKSPAGTISDRPSIHGMVPVQKLCIQG